MAAQLQPRSADVTLYYGSGKVLDEDTRITGGSSGILK